MTVQEATAVPRDSAHWGLPPDNRAVRDPRDIEVLVPCFGRTPELAVTLSGLAAQSNTDFDVVLSDQTDRAVAEDAVVASMIRLLRAQGRQVTILRNLPRRGMAQQRQFLLEHSSAPRVLYLDSDVWLEPGTVKALGEALATSGAGFVGSAVQGLSWLQDRRPHEWGPLEFWEGQVRPEPAPRSGVAHERWSLHNAANPTHLAAQLGRPEAGEGKTRALYRVAWVGGCVMFDRDSLVAVGGFSFWTELPAAHAGEDVLAQWRVMERDGGAAMLPSGAVHLETPTTVPDRTMEATELLEPGSAGSAGAGLGDETDGDYGRKPR